MSETTLTIYYQNKRINIHKLFPAYIKNKYSTYEQDMPESVKVSEWDDVRIKKMGKQNRTLHKKGCRDYIWKM